jgi:uncharacterized protein (DUF1501 family)
MAERDRSSSAVFACPGPIGRREFLRFGLGGFSSLALPGLFHLRARAATTEPRPPGSLIVVWLHGGASHLESFDPKPDAPSEYRGPYNSIATRTPGMRFCELFPALAGVTDKIAVLRSLVHTGFCHDDGPQQIFTGHPKQGRRLKPEDPDLFSIVNFLRSGKPRVLPNYVGVNPIPYLGSAYLGPSYEPFALYNDPNAPDFQVPNLTLSGQDQVERLRGRIGLRKSFDQVRRDIDEGGNVKAIDAFESQAWNLLTGVEARRAFDLHREDPKTRDRYGRNMWGQQCLLARRLVEAGVELVTVTLNGQLAGRTGSWDDHAVNHNVFEIMKLRAPLCDQAVAALIEDVFARGLDRHVMVVVAGDFGRTPKISYAASTGEGRGSAPAGVTQPGRDHWPSANVMLFAGGGVPPGQLIGATDRRGEHAVERRVGVGDFLATVYRHLGIDPERVVIPDFTGRPIPILQDGKPIPELIG